MKSLRSFLANRVVRNVFIWLLALYLRLSYFDFQYTAGELCFLLLIMAELMALLYFNNLVLIPSLLARRKPVLYVITVLVCILGYAYGASKTIYLAHSLYPAMSAFRITWAPIGLDTLPPFRILVGSTTTFTVVLVFIFSLVWYAADHSRRSRELKQSRSLQQETELHFLKNQLQPHFLFNTLNNIYGTALQQPEAAPPLILKLSILLRYLLYGSNEKQVSFRNEMELMQAFLELESLRFRNGTEIDFELGCDRDDYLVPPLLWLPVLENLFKYGDGNSAEMMFHCGIAHSLMTIRSGNAFNEADIKERKGADHGLGLSNLEKRLQLLFPGRHHFETKQSNAFFTITVTIELT